MNFTPIVLFVYNRPIHTQMVLNGLAKNPESKHSILYVFCDGAKDNSSPENIHNISMTRQIIQSENRFKEIVIEMHPKNLGLANSIIYGVNKVINRFEKVIVLEDDILPMIGFLKYMNTALNMYENNEDVGCIHAWNYCFSKNSIKDSTFFLKGADCWGWGTWKRAWDLFEENGQLLLNEIISSKREFEFNRRGTQPYINMLKDQINGKNNSWAVRWHASLILKNKFCLQPTRSIVKNIGFDGTGVHCGVETIRQKPVSRIKLKKMNLVKENLFFYKDFHFYKMFDEPNFSNNKNFFSKKSPLKNFIKKISHKKYSFRDRLFLIRKFLTTLHSGDNNYL
jgi:hypothetical protein